MPSVDTLMQIWPQEYEDLLKELSLPSSELNVDLNTYIDIICALLDIPVYKSRVQSIHLLFSLFSEFKNSQVGFLFC
jgi:intraflagellar transport protein 46